VRVNPEAGLKIYTGTHVFRKNPGGIQRGWRRVEPGERGSSNTQSPRRPALKRGKSLSRGCGMNFGKETRSEPKGSRKQEVQSKQ